ncbi:MAG: hypothetical protein ABFR62_08195 [Bacteroidota bacterium]
MKKLVLLLAVVLLSNSDLFSQSGPYSIGLRLGGGSEFGAELSYQHTLGGNGRLEADLGFYNHHTKDYGTNGFKLTGIYQWVLPIDNGFYWYFGGGVSVGNYSYVYYDDDKFNKHGTFLSIPLNIGIEYRIPKAPLNFSLDFRPELGVLYPTNRLFGAGIALGIRYTL